MYVKTVTLTDLTQYQIVTISDFYCSLLQGVHLPQQPDDDIAPSQQRGTMQGDRLVRREQRLHAVRRRCDRRGRRARLLHRV